ncbi:MAG: hypothetical protein ACI84C_000451 [Flavobacteriales bacterium]|jgi:uncharacterized protein (TIGR00255 family)
MIKSMTGFGRAEGTIGPRKFTVEIRTLNSKQLDVHLRMPSVYKEKEMILRSSLANRIVRGKTDMTIFYESDSTEKKVTINKALMVNYYNDLKEVSDSIGQANTDFMGILMRIPDILRPERESFDETEWVTISAMIEDALVRLDEYRSTEGGKLKQDFIDRIHTIMNLYDQLEEPLSTRMVQVRERIQGNLDEFVDAEKIDQNRFEQELIFYLERLDITEERVRLKSNCDYFLEVLENEDAPGKKLGFIGQEIGREINTMGSKANNAEVQKIVVQMKDELEKIKEQVLNVL